MTPIVMKNSLTSDGAVQRALDLLQKNAVTYEKNGAIWFRATDYGDEKDRVVVRDNDSRAVVADRFAVHFAGVN